MNIYYKIIFTFDKEGEFKLVPSDWVADVYKISLLDVGRAALLVGRSDWLTTSPVEKVSMKNNVLIITTGNTIYHLKPIVLEEKED